MPHKNLPVNPDLDHLKNQAKDLQRAQRMHDAAGLQRIREFHPRFSSQSDAQLAAANFSLSDAQLTIAREYGFASWPKLKDRVETRDSTDQSLPLQDRIDDPDFRNAVDRIDQGDAAGLRTLLGSNPGLVRQKVFFGISDYFGQPTLLEFIAENPIRHDTVSDNVIEVARVILETGPETDSINRTLGLVSSGKIVRECGVQIPLVELLCKYGADPDLAMNAALIHGEFDAVEALICQGANVDLPVAAATGRTEEARKLLGISTAEEGHQALALAAQFGRTEIIRILLETGEDPNRFNPVGFHSHSTPLHQAAFYGHLEVVKLLVEHGASTRTKDIMFNGTPLGWAEHRGRAEVAEYLRALD